MLLKYNNEMRDGAKLFHFLKGATGLKVHK